METYKKNWYAVITADVLYNDQLTPRQKLLVAVIANLANEKGYCFATNNFFARMMGCSAETIRRDIAKLEQAKAIKRVIKLKDNNEVEIRVLTPTPSLFTPPSNSSTPPLKNEVTPPLKNEGYNNILTNNKDNSIYNQSSENGTSGSASNDKTESSIKQGQAGGKAVTFEDKYKAFIALFNRIAEKTSGVKRRFRGDNKTKRQFRARLKEGYTSDDFRRAVYAMYRDGWHNESAFKWATPELITRPEKLEMFVNKQLKRR